MKNKKEQYWVQSLYAVIDPNGQVENYYFTKREAVTEALNLNTNWCECIGNCNCHSKKRGRKKRNIRLPDGWEGD